MDKTWLGIFQIVISVLLTLVVLLQQRGTGLSSTFGGLTEVYSTRRGLEKTIFALTIILGALLVGSVVLDLLLA